jgi:hypothetical protein
LPSSDAPQPPGGPLRDDAPDGDLAADEQREDLPEGELDHGSDDGAPVPPVSHEPSQSDEEAEVQQENAETSLDQPSS